MTPVILTGRPTLASILAEQHQRIGAPIPPKPEPRKGDEMNLAEALLARHRDNDEPGLTAEQQITRLTEFYAQVFGAEPERFEPGQIVWHKNPPLATSKGSADPHLFIGYLPEPIECSKLMHEPADVGSSAAAMIVDCRVASIFHGHFTPHLMASRELTATAVRERT